MSNGQDVPENDLLAEKIELMESVKDEGTISLEELKRDFYKSCGFIDEVLDKE